MTRSKPSKRATTTADVPKSSSTNFPDGVPQSVPRNQPSASSALAVPQSTVSHTFLPASQSRMTPTSKHTTYSVNSYTGALLSAKALEHVQLQAVPINFNGDQEFEGSEKTNEKPKVEGRKIPAVATNFHVSAESEVQLLLGSMMKDDEPLEKISKSSSKRQHKQNKTEEVSRLQKKQQLKPAHVDCGGRTDSTSVQVNFESQEEPFDQETQEEQAQRRAERYHKRTLEVEKQRLEGEQIKKEKKEKKAKKMHMKRRKDELLREEKMAASKNRPMEESKLLELEKIREKRSEMIRKEALERQRRARLRLEEEKSASERKRLEGKETPKETFLRQQRERLRLKEEMRAINITQS